MCEFFHRARARKISLNNGSLTPTFSLPIGKFRPQVSVLKCLLLIRFAVCLQSYRVSLQRKKRCQQTGGLDDKSYPQNNRKQYYEARQREWAFLRPYFAFFCPWTC